MESQAVLVYVYLAFLQEVSYGDGGMKNKLDQRSLFISVHWSLAFEEDYIVNSPSIQKEWQGTGGWRYRTVDFTGTFIKG